MASLARFYVAAPLNPAAQILLPREEAHHARRVLRLQDGDEVTLFDGEGRAVRALLRMGADKDALLAEIIDVLPSPAEAPYAITVAQGLCAAEKMDWVVEKSVELGAACLIPLALERSVTRLAPERAQKRVLHWQQLVIAASKQCGRNRLMRITPPEVLSQWLAESLPQALKFVLDPGATHHLAALVRDHPPDDTVLVTGPEGGFTASELALLHAAGFVSAGLGAHVLRTETAAMTALATLHACWCP